MSATSSGVIVGIDLGTTNCAVAWADPGAGRDAAVRDFPVVQVQRPGEIAPRPMLPSAIYLAGEHEIPAEAVALPWGAPGGILVGEGARWQGARVPGRLVTSAKSWLCHPGVDRSAAILPWGSTAELARISPVEASARLLGHIAAAWDHAHPDRPLTDQEVVVTVPASFDEVARALTVEAAKRAGFKTFTLLEEPQAAFYDFTARRQADLAAALAGVRLVLVVDVGGGTTDLTLIQVSLTESGPALRRIAVSDHLMLGGDNMDAALARAAEERLVSGGRRLSTPQWSQLVQAARGAKEVLLGAGAPERQRVAIAGEGSRLLGATLATEFSREDVEGLVLEGFFPACAPDEEPRRAARTGLQELGLPYAQDPAITRHIAAFLRRHATAGHAALGIGDSAGGPGEGAASPRPDAILLNGGVFNSPRLAARLVEAVSAWWPAAPRIPLLPHESLDLAVARGAARYGLVRRGLGRRISGGVAHALYVGLAPEKGSSEPRAVCLIPRGHEEGEQVDLSSRPFLLTLGQPVQFPLYSTTADRVDRAGDVVPVDESFHPLPPIHTVFRGASVQARAIPVHLRAGLTELGSLEIWCVANEADERWRLEFDLRAASARGTATVTESMPERFGEARELVARIFGSRAQPVEPKVVKDLVRTIEQAVGPRDTWSLPLLRELWSLLLAGKARRRRSEHHERAFFQLVGFCLRPGFGYPLDEWRCAETYPLFAERVHHHREVRIWREYWVTWRRIAAGLDAVQQAEIWDYLKPNLARRLPVNASKNQPALKGVQPEGLDEMVRTAASLELLAPGEKELLGRWLVGRIRQPDATAGPWAWALGRVGARIPLGGSVHQCVEAGTVAEWVDALLACGLSMQDGSAFAAVQLSRLSGDRTRDLDDDVRARVVDALGQIDAPERWRRLVEEVAVMEAADEARSLGDTLPIGLRLS